MNNFQYYEEEWIFSTMQSLSLYVFSCCVFFLHTIKSGSYYEKVIKKYNITQRAKNEQLIAHIYTHRRQSNINSV